jgi:hypothetical protein
MISLFVFAYVFAIHIILHRVLLRAGTVSLKTLAVYPAGLILMLYLPSPVYMILFYSLFSLLVSVLYLGVCLGGQTPASMILDAYKGKKSFTEKQLIALFSPDLLLWKRLDDLLRSKLVTKTRDRYCISPGGNVLYTFFHAYQTLINSRKNG